MLVSWLWERTIPPPLFSLLAAFTGSSEPSPTMKCTTLLSGGVSFPVSLLDESGGNEDSFHARLSRVPADQEEHHHRGSSMRNNSMQRWKLCKLEDKRRKKNQPTRLDWEHLFIFHTPLRIT